MSTTPTTVSILSDRVHNVYTSYTGVEGTLQPFYLLTSYEQEIINYGTCIPCYVGNHHIRHVHMRVGRRWAAQPLVRQVRFFDGLKAWFFLSSMIEVKNRQDELSSQPCQILICLQIRNTHFAIQVIHEIKNSGQWMQAILVRRVKMYILELKISTKIISPKSFLPKIQLSSQQTCRLHLLVQMFKDLRIMPPPPHRNTINEQPCQPMHWAFPLSQL